MKQRLVRVDPLCAARVAALLTFLPGLAVLPFLHLAFVAEPERLGFSGTVVFLIPVLISGLAFALAAIGCFLFNWLASRFGGLEIELRDVGR